ncbi:endolytic transglycosylase MltG [Sulfitobacter sp. D35]|uniref:endolytic transglycosylase MltG n=1 Tax=Sulfitobacter sp. D35 TaxID=3083252 RepID=UPI00296F799E|nr:endolytic transglycosylase MltG [Sulfitobacter sp. D35]MDW4496824.1 endolytic transglycosylase MltG [Sulfitobacter sp. D35]
MWRNIASNAVTFLIVGLFLFGGVILWGRAQYTGPGPLADAMCVQVERGSNFRRLSAQLADEGAISSAAIMRMGADYAEKSDELKAGSYLVEPQASMQKIVDVVTRGGASTCGTEVVYRVGINRMNVEVRELDPTTNRFEERADFVPAEEETPAVYSEKRELPDTRYRIALAEGVTSWQVVESLKAIDALEGDVAELPPEGSLAPNSYEVSPGDDRAELIAKMQSAQEVLVAEAWQNRGDDLPVGSPEELVILASIIEKETGVPEERGQVASVFVNRLREGMRLQTDPTVIYGVTKGQGVLGRGLRQSELRKATPWNTYVIQGLPPTPIANPGRESLAAAAQPQDTDFLFFVADGTGGHAFAKTLEEHNANVAEWRKIEAEQAEQTSSN